MAKQVIDLRKQSSLQDIATQLSASSSDHNNETKIPAIAPIPHAATQMDREYDLEWSCYEHEYRLRGPYWFLYPLTGATGGIVFGIASRSYLFVIFILIAFLMFLYYAKHPPRIRTYRIEKRGIWIDDKLISYNKLTSFWIFTHALMAPELLLANEHPINPVIHIRLEGVNPDSVKHAISQYLPEKEQKDAISDQIARIIGF